MKNIQPQTGPKVRVAHTHNFFDRWFLLTVNQPIEYFKAEPKEVMAIKWFTPEEFEKEIMEHPEQFLKGMPQWKKLFKK